MNQNLYTCTKRSKLRFILFVLLIIALAVVESAMSESCVGVTDYNFLNIIEELNISK